MSWEQQETSQQLKHKLDSFEWLFSNKKSPQVRAFLYVKKEPYLAYDKVFSFKSDCFSNLGIHARYKYAWIFRTSGHRQPI